MDPKCLDMLYKARIRSKIEFCSFIYPSNKKILKMERVQWKACRIITGCMLSTHTQSLEVIAAITQLKLRFERMTERFATVLESQRNYPMKEKRRILKALDIDYMKSNNINDNIFKFESFPFYNELGWDHEKEIVNKQMKEKISRKSDCTNIEMCCKYKTNNTGLI